MVFDDMRDFYEWFEDQSTKNRYRVTTTPLGDLRGWTTNPDTGNIEHERGGFFTIEGLDVQTDHREVAQWSQPIIVQPEIGILGIIVKRFNGERHFLMQLKMEPGNSNMIQISPTVQATKSNYTRVHGGKRVPYLEYFVAPRRGRTMFDALQSEQGSWFLNKRNRNMLVEVFDPVAVYDNFCWLSIKQIRELMTVPNLMNMDSRTVLSGVPDLQGPDHIQRSFELNSTASILSWFTEARSRYSLQRNLIPLRAVNGWVHDGSRIEHTDRKYFEVIGVDVEASDREIIGWSQPMIAPLHRGVIAFVGRWFEDQLHLIVHARTEAGTSDVVEMGPTVNCIPENYSHHDPVSRPKFLDYIASAPPHNVVIDIVHSEEGGRFYHAENNYMLVEADDSIPDELPIDYIWMRPDQLAHFIQYGNYVNVAARCLVMCIIQHYDRDEVDRSEGAVVRS